MLETSHIDLEKAGGEGAPRVCQSNKTSVFAQISPGICSLESKELDFQLYCFPLSQILPAQKGEKCGLPTGSKSKAPHPSNRLAGFGFSLQDTDRGSQGLCECGTSRNSPKAEPLSCSWANLPFVSAN